MGPNGSGPEWAQFAPSALGQTGPLDPGPTLNLNFLFWFILNCLRFRMLLWPGGLAASLLIYLIVKRYCNFIWIMLVIYLLIQYDLGFWVVT